MLNALCRLVGLFAYYFSGFMPRDRRKLLFGAWMGNKFLDNPKYLLQHLIAHEHDCDLIWVGKRSVAAQLPADLPVRFVARGSIAAYWEMLTAGYCFVTHGQGDIGVFNLMRGACRVHLGHGLAIKNMGSKDPPSSSWIQDRLRRLRRWSYSFSYYTVSSEVHRDKCLVEYASCNASVEQMIESGQPRVDYLIHATAQVQLAIREALLAECGIPLSAKVITYMPTFRDDPDAYCFSFSRLSEAERDSITSLLERHNAYILEKSHYADSQRNEGRDCDRGTERLITLSSLNSLGPQELLLATDLLITDYSGCYVDYLVLDRPVVHYAYDREYYESSDRGLYFDLDQVAGGPILSSFDELCAALAHGVGDRSYGRVQREFARKTLAGAEEGTACETIVATIPGMRENGILA